MSNFSELGSWTATAAATALLPPLLPMARVPLAIPRPWILDLVPLLVVLLIAAHVFALVYWIYRLATDKQPQWNKDH
ncbi:uncharacterized protein [Typha latifolia]|uniref:uncharacterized protein n=1 Tax=Typha latifolia TaxID=4733 RepID=UPI003C2E9884